MRSINRVNTNPGIGLRVKTPHVSAVAANWWDPNNVGLSVADAWRAIDTPGSPWGAGPANYAASKVGLVNATAMGEIGGAVNWAAATGWSGFFALVRALDTTIVPVNNQQWSLVVQFANGGNAVAMAVIGMNDGANRWFLIQHTRPNSVGYFSGGFQVVAPNLASGNLAIVGNQGYRNGIADGPVIVPAVGVFVRSIFIGAANVGGNPSQPTDAEIWAAVVYNANPAQVTGEALAIATAMSQL